MRKLVFAICEQQWRRSACASAHSDQRLDVLCLDCIIPNPFKSIISRLASVHSGAGRFVSHLVAHPEDWFSGDEAQGFLVTWLNFIQWLTQAICQVPLIVNTSVDNYTLWN